MRRLAEAETFGTTERIGRLQIVRAVDASVARGPLHIFLAEARLIDGVADFEGGALDTAATLLTVREAKESISTLVTRAALDVSQATACSVVQIALQVISGDTQRFAVTRFAAEILVESIRIGFALVTPLADHVRCADTSARFLLTQQFRRTIAWLTIGETEIARATRIALSTDDVRLALALTAERIAFE